MKLDLLAIAAHPDDVELTCGGTLVKMAQKGYRTGILDLTRGEMGTRGTPEIRKKEASQAAKILGVKVRENLALPDARLAATEENKLAIARIVRAWKPATVILPYWQGRHPDHYTASILGYEGCFLAGLRRLSLPGQPFRPFKVLYSAMYADVRPTFAVDITAQFERRRRAILAYRSQFAPPARERFRKLALRLDRLEAEMNLIIRYFGRMIGVDYAEPFVVREIMQVEDVVKMPVRSV